MKKLLTILMSALLILLPLSSCGEMGSDSGLTTEGDSTVLNTAEKPETENPASSSSEQSEPVEEAQMPAGLTFEDVQTAYPDKTVLVWCLPDFYRTELEVNAEVNKYLDSLGKDYAVYFKMMNYFSKDGEYIDLLKKRIAEGEPVDILYTAEIPEDSSILTFSYHSYVLEGLLEPLDGYFEDTEIGRKLYNQMPENYWKLLSVDGSIYAADGGSQNYSRPSGYCVNKELAEKYGFDITKPVSEQLDVLEKVRKGEWDCDTVFFPIKIGYSAYYPEVFEGLMGIVYDYGSDRLIRLTEDKAFLDRLSEINSLASSGYVNSNNSIRAKNFFVSFAAADAITVGDIGSEAIEYHADSTPIEVLNVYNTDRICFKPPNTATGVCSHSGNKDMAFDLLATVMTDGYLNDLLAGGEDGRFAMIFSDKFRNEAVSSITDFENAVGYYYEPEGYNELYLSALEGAQLPPYIGFAFDVSPVSEQYRNVRNIIKNYDFAQNREMSEILDEVNQQLDDAGINAVLDEVNRQYKEWRTKE